MRRSKAISLVMLGTLVGCDGAQPPQVPVKQNHYDSLAGCQKDWGDAKDCQTRSSGGGYMGPRYIWTGSGYPMAVGPDGATHALPNSYLATGRPSVATGATSAFVSVPSGSAAAAHPSAIARGGFGASAHAVSAGS